MNYPTLEQIYDNGALMLGNVQKIISYIESDDTLENWSIEDMLNELEELRNIDNNMIVCINYENPMGYSIDYWTSKDVVR